jgi:hypothetical protein
MSINYMCPYLVVLGDDDVIAVDIESSVGGDWLRECRTIDCYLLMVYICQALVRKMGDVLSLYLDDIRIGNH